MSECGHKRRAIHGLLPSSFRMRRATALPQQTSDRWSVSSRSEPSRVSDCHHFKLCRNSGIRFDFGARFLITYLYASRPTSLYLIPSCPLIDGHFPLCTLHSAASGFPLIWLWLNETLRNSEANKQLTRDSLFCLLQSSDLARA